MISHSRFNECTLSAYRIMVIPQPSKLMLRVRFSLRAQSTLFPFSSMNCTTLPLNTRNSAISHLMVTLCCVVFEVMLNTVTQGSLRAKIGAPVAMRDWFV